MKHLFVVAVALAVLGAPAVAGEVVYDGSMSPAAIAIDKANRAELRRQDDANDVWCPAASYDYRHADPDMTIRSALRRECVNDGNSASE